MKTLATSLLNVLADGRYTLRGLANSTSYTITAVLSLALGLGATTTMLGILDSVLVRPISLPKADQLVTIIRTDKSGDQGNFDFGQLETIRQGVPGLADLL